MTLQLVALRQQAGAALIRVLRDLMGHKSIRTTLRYAKVNGDRAKKAFREFDRTVKANGTSVDTIRSQTYGDTVSIVLAIDASGTMKGKPLEDAKASQPKQAETHSQWFSRPSTATNEPGPNPFLVCKPSSPR
jgi:hypothetical protein